MKAGETVVDANEALYVCTCGVVLHINIAALLPSRMEIGLCSSCKRRHFAMIDVPSGEIVILPDY